MTLLIFNNSSGALQIYKFDSPIYTDDFLKSCHGCYINSSNEHEYSEDIRTFLKIIGSGEYSEYLIFDDTDKHQSVFDVAPCTIVVAGIL